MTKDLFAEPDRLERLPIQDAEISYLSSIGEQYTAPQIIRELIEQTPWRSETIVLWGKPHRQPRLSSWHGDQGASYTYSGIKLDPQPWTKLLLSLKRRIEELSDARFNSVLLNYYRHQRDSMGMHSDDEPELGSQPVIASLSLGAERELVFKHRLDQSLPTRKITLAHGSLLLMAGETQQNWKHGINKQTAVCSPRVNLTFRKIRI